MWRDSSRQSPGKSRPDACSAAQDTTTKSEIRVQKKKLEDGGPEAKQWRAALAQFRIAQVEVERAYRRFHEHLGKLLRRPMRRGKPPTLSLVFSDCAYIVFDRGNDAQRFAVSAIRSFVRNDMPVRMGLSYGSFTAYNFTTETLPSGHTIFGAPFMGTAVVDAYKAESSGIKGMRILVHPSFYMNAGDLNDVLVPLPKSEQRLEAVGELNWYDLDLRLTLRRHVRKMKHSAGRSSHSLRQDDVFSPTDGGIPFLVFPLLSD